MRRSLVLAWLLCAACGARSAASRPAPGGTSGGEATARFRAVSSAAAAQTALDALRAQVEAGDRAALAAVGVALAEAGGAHEMTGEAAQDERIASARVVGQQGDAAALLVSTSCGNAVLASVRWDGTRWQHAQHLPLVEGMRPGRCAQTSARAEALALTSDARRELATVVVSQDVTGESVRGPFLSVYQLGPGGALAPLLVEAPFGAMDDATGATTTGEYSVIEDVPPPRALYVSIRPGRPGPGGAPAQEIVRQRYVLRAGRLQMETQTSESAE